MCLGGGYYNCQTCGFGTRVSRNNRVYRNNTGHGVGLWGRLSSLPISYKNSEMADLKVCHT